MDERIFQMIIILLAGFGCWNIGQGIGRLIDSRSQARRAVNV